MGAYHSHIIKATSHGQTSYCIGFSWENVKEKLEGTNDRPKSPAAGREETGSERIAGS